MIILFLIQIISITDQPGLQKIFIASDRTYCLSICRWRLARANESRQTRRPRLAYRRASGAIEQDADIVLALYRDGYYNKECENPNLAEAIILKNRHGETGTLELMWLPEYTSFAAIEKKYDDDDY